MVHERSAGFVIFRRFNKQVEYLLMLASEVENCWSPPKGHVESNEDDKQTALREVQEEAGYTEKDLLIYDDIIKKLNYKSGKNDKTVVYFLAELKDVKKQPKLSHEHTEYRWLAKDEAISTSRFATYAELFNYFDEKIENL